MILIYGIKKITWNEPLSSSDYYDCTVLDEMFTDIEKAKAYIENNLLKDYLTEFTYDPEEREYSDRNSEQNYDTEAMYTSFVITDYNLHDWLMEGVIYYDDRSDIRGIWKGSKAYWRINFYWR